MCLTNSVVVVLGCHFRLCIGDPGIRTVGVNWCFGGLRHVEVGGIIRRESGWISVKVVVEKRNGLKTGPNDEALMIRVEPADAV